jgi:hypothetical protein
MQEQLMADSGAQDLEMYKEDGRTGDQYLKYVIE